MSRHTRPRGDRSNVSSAWASLTPPRETQGWSLPRTPSGASSSSWRPGLSSLFSPLNTAPAMTSARARSRLGARPRATSSMSSRCFATASTPSGDGEIGGGAQQVGAGAEIGERRRRPARQGLGALPRARRSEKRHQRRLAGAGVLACRLAQRRRVAFEVEQVVGDLEGEAEGARIFDERLSLARAPRRRGARRSRNSRRSALLSCGAGGRPASARPGARPGADKSIACPPAMP